jgi:two-component system OmpR family sensor kinase
LLARTFNDLLHRLETSLTQQRQFMADASHELRTPVTTTRTAAAVALQQSHRDEQEYRETLAIVEQQTTRLSRIVEDMFTLARADAGSYPVRMAPMYLDEIVEEVVRAARVIATTRQITIELQTPQSAVFTGDEDLVRRLIANLVDNAVRHARVSGFVRIALENRNGGYSITVSDDGPGVPLEAQPHIFERFYRADAARTTTDGGAGLGLALARWTARVHDGDVALVRSSDQGTTFSIHLPFIRR